VVSGFLVNFQAFVELFLSIFQNFSYQNSYDPILDSIQHSLYEIIKNRVSQSFSKECGFSHGFSHDFQLPAAPPYSADSAKPCRAAAGRVCAKRLEQQKWRKIGILPEKVGI